MRWRQRRTCVMPRRWRLRLPRTALKTGERSRPFDAGRIAALRPRVSSPRPRRAAARNRFDAWSMSRKLGFLQILRGLAALLVVADHALYYAADKAPLPAWHLAWSLGTLGVDIFFVISGFIM